MRTVVLLSGGIDSLVCAEIERQEERLAGLVFVDYGHPAQIPEGWKAFAYHGRTGIPLKVVHCFGLDLGDMASEEGARVVPHRNAILLSLAANAAAAMGGQRLIIGANADDREDYRDCRRAFIGSMAMALDMSIGAPLLEKGKREIVQLAKDYGLARNDAWSCYLGGPRPCGTCPSCVQAEEAWA